MGKDILASRGRPSPANHYPHPPQGIDDNNPPETSPPSEIRSNELPRADMEGKEFGTEGPVPPRSSHICPHAGLVTAWKGHSGRDDVLKWLLTEAQDPGERSRTERSSLTNNQKM